MVTASVAKIVTKLKQPDIGICPTQVLLQLEAFLAVRYLHSVSFVPVSAAVCCHRMYCVSSATRPPSGRNCTVWLLPARCRIYCMLFLKKLVKTHLAGRQQLFYE